MDHKQRDFTFIVLTYNHSQYIREHLDSIVLLVKKYGKDRNIDLIISDDCSTDDTTLVVDKWICTNYFYFRNIKKRYSTYNEGLVSNLIGALSDVETECLKSLAGDDKYHDSDIFTLTESIENNHMIVTPVLPIGELQGCNELIRRYRALIYAANKGRRKVLQLMKYDNYIQAPGVFLNSSMITPELIKYLSQFKNIEDYPMWHYMLFEKNANMTILNEPYICYRINSGISTNKNHNKRSAFLNEVYLIRRKLKMRKYILPKYLNIYRYLSKINQVIIARKKFEVNSLVGDNPHLKIYIK